VALARGLIRSHVIRPHASRADHERCSASWIAPTGREKKRFSEKNRQNDIAQRSMKVIALETLKRVQVVVRFIGRFD
jgi:hypothetical protein